MSNAPPALTVQLDESCSMDDSLAGFETTYREISKYGEHVSISEDRVRFDGTTVGNAGLRSQLRLGKRLGIV